MRTRTALITCTAEDIHLLDQLPAIGPERLAVLWDAMSQDPLRPFFITDWSATSFVEFLQTHGPGYLPIVAEAHACVAGVCWLHEMHLHPQTQRPLHCVVDIYVMPAFRGLRTGRLIGLAFKRHVIEVFEFPQFFAAVHPQHRACQRMMHAWEMHYVGRLPAYVPVDGTLQDRFIYSALPPQEKSDAER